MFVLLSGTILVEIWALLVPPPQVKDSLLKRRSSIYTQKYRPLNAPRRNSGLCHVCTGGNSTKRRKKLGSSVAYKTIGTFLSQDKRHEDACGWATEMRNSGCAAVRHRPTLCFTHRTCKFDLFLSS